MMNNLYFQLDGDKMTFVRLVSKISRTMKLTLFLVCLSVSMSFAIPTNAQSASLSIKVVDQSIKEVLETIENQTDFHFFYNSKLVDVNQVISVDIKNKDVMSTLDQIFKDSNIGYKVVGKDVILSVKESVQEPAQDKKAITGTVVDERGEPVIGANVVEKGTTNGTITDMDGRFTMEVGAKAVLVVSYIGFNAQDVAVGTKSNLTITLEEDTQALEEIVVVGYGVSKKSHLTGSVGSIKMDEDVVGRPSVEVGQSLYGKIAGVQVIGGSGQPGSSSSIQIRGINSISASSSPLVVIDGVAVPDYDMNLINNADIESVEILKDASSSAIYGSRGANGVVLITTKSGKTEKPKVNINYLFGVQKLMKKIDVMNSAEYAQAYMDAAQNGWVDKGGDPNAPNTIEARKEYKYTWPEVFEHPEALYDTDWQDVVFDAAPMHKLDANISGKSEKSDYLISAGYVNQAGIMLDSDYKKYSLSLKLNTHINKYLDVGGSMNLNYGDEKEVYWRTAEWAVQYPSMFPVYTKDGLLGCNSYLPGFENYNTILFRPNMGHPLYMQNNDANRYTLNTIGSAYVSLNILPGLKFKSSFNYYLKRIDYSNYEAKDHDLGEAYYTPGQMTVDQSRKWNYTFQNLMTYDKSWKDHELSFLLGFEYNKNDYYQTSQARRDYDNDLLHALSAGKTILSSSDVITKNTLMSYFARINYNYKDRYMLSVAFRRDGSSRFAPNNKWGNFPSVSLGWLVSEEDFMKRVDWINMLKLRTSYGLTGNDNFDDYVWIAKLKQAKIAFGNNLTTSYYPSNITNPDLKWERTQQFNVGLDWGILKSRIQLGLDYYYSTSDGLLLDVPVPAVTGFSSIFTNIGKLENKGVEFNISTYNVDNKNFSWNTNFNISKNKNKILELGPDNAPMVFTPDSYGGMQKINMVGHSVFNFYGYKYDGVYMNQEEIDNDPAHYETAKPGDGRYMDVNKDGVLNADDRTLIGDPNPKFIWGLTNNFKYKNFDLSILLQGAHDFAIYDDNAHRSLMYHEGRNFLKEVTDRWRSEENPGDGYHYRLSVDLGEYEKRPSSLWVDHASYFRLKSITLGYTLPDNIVKKMNMQFVRLYFNGLNLFTVTNTDVWDPESFRGDASDASARGVMGNIYPSSKVFSFGVNVGF
ncbi:TonB-dependent receptor [Parabacteroides sp.]